MNGWTLGDWIALDWAVLGLFCIGRAVVAYRTSCRSLRGWGIE